MAKFNETTEGQDFIDQGIKLSESETSDVQRLVRDIFNVEPAIGVVGGNASGPDGSALYDFGRYVFAGVRMKY